MKKIDKFVERAVRESPKPIKWIVPKVCEWCEKDLTKDTVVGYFGESYGLLAFHNACFMDAMEKP